MRPFSLTQHLSAWLLCATNPRTTLKIMIVGCILLVGHTLLVRQKAPFLPALKDGSSWGGALKVALTKEQPPLSNQIENKLIENLMARVITNIPPGENTSTISCTPSALTIECRDQNAWHNTAQHHKKTRMILWWALPQTYGPMGTLLFAHREFNHTQTLRAHAWLSAHARAMNG